MRNVRFSTEALLELLDIGDYCVMEATGCYVMCIFSGSLGTPFFSEITASILFKYPNTCGYAR